MFVTTLHLLPPPESLTPRDELNGKGGGLGRDTLQRLSKGVFVILLNVSSGRALAVLAVGALCVSSAGAGFALWSFRSSLSPDSVTYLDIIAQSIAQGRSI